MLFGKCGYQDVTWRSIVSSSMCHLPWGLIFPARPHLAMPRLAFQLTCSRWVTQWEDTGKGRCVYFPEIKCCAAADGSALEQVAAFDTTATQPGHLDRQSRTGLLLVMRKLGRKTKLKMLINSWTFGASSSFQWMGSSFLPPELPLSASRLAGLSLWAKSYVCLLLCLPASIGQT